MAKKGAFIMVVGDEGSILVHMQGGKVANRQFAATSDYTDTRPFLQAFEADPSAPIYMLVDVMDQSYLQQSLPPVSSLSINNLIKRKMSRDFAEEDLKGALQIGREKEGRKDWKYLFVTLSNSPQLQSWMDLVMELPNQFKGIYLLPVEAENFLHALREKASGKKIKRGKTEEGQPRWQLLVAHNKVGGFRQVVLRDGKLIFARLAQPIGDSQPEVVAGSIEQEISVTVEYLKRLGYSDDQGLDLYVITSRAIKASIDANNLPATASHLYTPHEVATLMKFGDATQEGDQFADVVLSVAFSKNSKHLLKLDTPASEKLSKMYTALLATKAGGAVAAVGMLGALGYFGLQVPGIRSDIEDLESQLKRTQTQLQRAKDLEAELPDNLDQITDLVTMHQSLSDLGLSPMESLHSYREAAAVSDVLLNSFTWQNNDGRLTKKETSSGRGRRGGGAAEKVEKTLNLSFSLDMYETQRGTEGFVEHVGMFNDKLQESFGNFDIELRTELPGDQDDEEIKIDLETEPVDPLLQEEFFTLEYQVTGPVEKEEEKDNKG